ncbi:hypothetical protein Tco_1524735 [Tanacetum coccineum]
MAQTEKKYLTRITHDEEEQEYSDSPSPVPQTTSIINATSSKNLLEAAEDTIGGLHSQMELSAAQRERDGMKKEVDHIKMLLKESVVKQKATMESNSTFKSEGQSQLVKEHENELKAHKEANVDLNQQLKRNQESNIELVCILQELEEMAYTQKGGN